MSQRSSDPLVVETYLRDDGLEVARQAPPAASAAFAASYIAPMGWAFERDGQGGVAGLTAQVAACAAGSRDRVALARFLDEHGATLNRRVDPESSQYTVTGPVSSIGPLLGVLADVVLRPRFAPDDLERARRQALEHQLRETTQPANRAERELLRAIFPPHHPYRDTGLGTPASVRRLTPGDLRKFHSRHMGAAGSLLIVTSPLSLSEVVRRARPMFRDFPLGSGGPPTLPVPAPRTGATRTIEIPMPGRSQVEILVGGPSIARPDPSYDAAFLANEVLGGGMMSRLFQRVRESDGLAYHASSDLEALRWGGYWTAQAGTGPERYARALRALREEVEDLRHRSIPIAELDRIRNNVIGEIPLAFETAAGAHDVAIDVAYDHLGAEFLREWPGRLKALAPSDLRLAAARAMGSDGSVVVLAGPLSSTVPGSA